MQEGAARWHTSGGRQYTQKRLIIDHLCSIMHIDPAHPPIVAY